MHRESAPLQVSCTVVSETVASEIVSRTDSANTGGNRHRRGKQSIGLGPMLAPGHALSTLWRARAIRDRCGGDASGVFENAEACFGTMCLSNRFEGCGPARNIHVPWS